MQIFSVVRAIYHTLDFLNLWRMTSRRLSPTKIGLWGVTRTNLANGIAQVGDQIRALLTDTPGHLRLVIQPPGRYSV